MPVKYLDPTLDIIFKMLLVGTPELLRDMLEAVLNPDTPIESVLVLNPEIPKDFPTDKSIALDLRIRLVNGDQIDLEMQSTNPEGTQKRFLYYWAKTFAAALKIGEDYTALRKTISILWLKKPLLTVPGFHSVFHVAEDHTHEVFSRVLELHVLELSNLDLAPPDRRAKLERWARFLTARTPEELEALAKEDPMMDTARNALERLSSDPDAQRLADERETAILVHQHYMASAFEAGKADERRETVRTLCRVFGIVVDEERAQRLAALEASQLSLLIQKLELERQWPRDW